MKYLLVLLLPASWMFGASFVPSATEVKDFTPISNTTKEMQSSMLKANDLRISLLEKELYYD